MENKNLLVSLVAVLALVTLFVANASALGTITSVKVNDVEGLASCSKLACLDNSDIAVFAGETLPVRVTFVGDADASDVRVKVWVSGAREYTATTDRIHVFNGKTYSKLFAVTVPANIDPQEELTLKVAVESMNDGSAAEAEVKLSAQRESYIVEILDVNMPSKIGAGESLPLGIVLKNRGIEFSEDTFVRAKITALGVEQKSYFGDLSPVDQTNPDKEDAAERTMYLRIPANAKAGVYNVELEAYNGDSITTMSKKIVVAGASEESMVVSSSTAKTFAVGQKQAYTLTLVNSGNKVKVYELVLEGSDGLTVDTDETVLAVPAGSSNTVKVYASAQKAGDYDFAVNVYSNGDLVKKESFTAKVGGKSATSSGSTGNTTVLLTVVLAIVFVVLLVVLIVLLTRKPEKSKEFGESYY